MARPRRIDKALVAKARQVVARTTEVEELRAAQAVLLPGLGVGDPERTGGHPGRGSGHSPTTAKQRLRQWVRPRATRPRWGGRRKALLSAEQETEFLAPWAEQAKEAGLLVPARFRQRLQQLAVRCTCLGGVAAVSPPRVAQGGPRHAPPQERSRGARGVEKKLPETLAAALNRVDLRGRSVRLMFQDEARFGRMARPRRCSVPLPWRAVMLNGYERQFVYVYGAVSPLQGDLDWMLCGEMNTVRMGEFLGQVSRDHPDEFIVMVVDSPSHKAKAGGA